MSAVRSAGRRRGQAPVRLERTRPGRREDGRARPCPPALLAGARPSWSPALLAPAHHVHRLKRGKRSSGDTAVATLASALAHRADTLRSNCGPHIGIPRSPSSLVGVVSCVTLITVTARPRPSASGPRARRRRLFTFRVSVSAFAVARQIQERHSHRGRLITHQRDQVPDVRAVSRA